MKVLTKNTDYAVRAVLALAKNRDRLLSAREISSSEHIPFAFLRSILQQLVREEVISAKEGANGGLKLDKDPRTLSVSDIINIFQGRVELSECIFKKKLCPNRASCVLRKRIKKVEDEVINKFSKITIGDLLKDLGGPNGKKKNHKN